MALGTTEEKHWENGGAHETNLGDHDERRSSDMGGRRAFDSESRLPVSSLTMPATATCQPSHTGSTCNDAGKKRLSTKGSVGHAEQLICEESGLESPSLRAEEKYEGCKQINR